MRKVTFLLLAAIVFYFCGTVASGQQSLTINPVMSDTLITVQELRVKPLLRHKIATQAISRGEKPGEFAGVNYRYASNVKPLSARQVSQISMKQDGLLDLSGKPAFVPHPDTVYIDP
ncbi:MAG TPA: hypothetical protein VK861_05100, partial [Bacteroidales bacterium]|nr:hypothetical protein [Bacteroidales bacterium]